jgi:hypothetical protein
MYIDSKAILLKPLERQLNKKAIPCQLIGRGSHASVN